MRRKEIYKKIVWRIQDNVVQWLWFALKVDKDHVGYDRGLLTWLRKRGHRKQRKKVHICFLDIHPAGGKFGKFTAFWINEKSALCFASVNEGIEQADIIWIYSQDPLPSPVREELLLALRRARPGIPVINHPVSYNSYHDDDVFHRLESAGVNVPRSVFGDEDIGKTSVVYKVKGAHGGSKFLSPYRGQVHGYRPFEFIDSRGPDGLYRKYRAFYVAGAILPNHIQFSEEWNVHRETRTRVEYCFDLSEDEIRSLRTIARTLDIQYFSVDFLRRRSDNSPVFTDINVYPLPVDFTETARENGYFGRWFIIDNRFRLGLPEVLGKPFWELFDEAMEGLILKKND